MFIFSVAWHRGDEDSPKRQGGLWPFVTFIGVIVGIMGLMSNILFLGDYKDDRSIYEDGNYDRPMSFARDMFIHGAAGLLCIIIDCASRRHISPIVCNWQSLAPRQFSPLCLHLSSEDCRMVCSTLPAWGCLAYTRLTPAP